MQDHAEKRFENKPWVAKHQAEILGSHVARHKTWLADMAPHSRSAICGECLDVQHERQRWTKYLTPIEVMIASI